MISPVIITALSILISSQLLLSLAPSLGENNQLPVSNPVSAPVSIQPAPVRIASSDPRLEAQAVYAYDRSSGQILYQKDAGSRRPIASITKLATAMTIVHSHKLEQVVTIPKLPAYKPEDEVIGLQEGDQYTVHDLLRALLVSSANDAADALAIIDSGDTKAFSTNMTNLMHDWGIKDVEFNNPSGLIDTGNSASAKAVAQMGLLVLHNPAIEKIVSTSVTSITSKSGRALPVKTTNILLQNNHFKGIKTGYTPASGQCFVGLATIDGHEVITVVLNSPDRFGETQSLINWIDRTYQWQ